MKLTTTARFWSHVVKLSGGDTCWEWQGSLRTGYGQFRLGSKSDGTRRVMGAHRFSYELHFAPIPKGIFVCHSCDNRKCVRPEHLFLGSAKDNTHDAMSKGRLVEPPTFRGIKNRQAKLNPKLIREIRKRCKAGESQQKVADSMGVSQPVVSSIIRKKAWKHVTA